MTPTVSVVMGAYNGAADLPRTMESILNQEGVDFEFIIVDDGSTDDTPKLLAHYAAQDARIRVIRQDNAGLTRALIAGCDAAQGKYIARQDVGDHSLPGRLQRQQQMMEADDTLAFCACWTRMEAMGGEALYESRGTGSAATPQWVLDVRERWGMRDGPSTHAATMFRRDAYQRAGGYRAAFRLGQDWDLWYRLAVVGRYQALPETLYVYRFDYSGLSASRRAEQARFAELSLNAMRRRAEGLPDADVLMEAAAVPPTRVAVPARQRRSEVNYFIGCNLLRNRNRAALRYLLASLKDSPLQPRGWWRVLQAACLRGSDTATVSSRAA